MGFTEMEQAGKRLLEQYPALKHGAKRVYQRVSVWTNPKKTVSEGELRRVSPQDSYEYFYGYYDKSPWDAGDRFMLCLRVQQAWKSVAPQEPATVCLIDTQEGGRVIPLGTSHAWNVQQACMAQWLGPDFASRVIWNDFRDGQYCAVVYNVQEHREERVLPRAVYDVARDGSFAVSLDFSRLHRMRPGYGYANLPDASRGVLCPDEPCIWRMALDSGETAPLLRYTDFAAFEPDPSMTGAEHKVNHLMISPNGKRMMVLHRWFLKGRKHTRLVTLNTDGTELYNLSDDVFVSHCFWKNDEEILAFLRKKESGDHYYLMRDRTREYSLHWPRLATDGHCSYSPDRSLVVTDSYPNRKRMAFVYICTEEQSQPVRIAAVFSPFRYDNDCRCDLHPRWNRAGTMVCIDSVHEGKRGLYVIPVEKKDIPPRPGPAPELIRGRKKICYVITQCKNTGPMNQTLNIIRHLDREAFQPVVVTLFPEDLGNSVVQRYLDTVPEFHCLGMSRLESIRSGKRLLAEKLAEIKPDLIHALGMPPYTMSLAYRDAAHLVTMRNYVWEDYPDKYGKKLGNLLARRDMHTIRRQVRRGETFVTCSESLSAIWKEKEKLDFGFIRNGVDVSRFPYADAERRAGARAALGLPAEGRILCTSGQFIDRKDQGFLIDGVLSTPEAADCVFLLMGDGPNLKALRERFRDEPRIRFTGSVVNVQDYLAAADVYLSAAKSEGMPNGVLEAMAVGLPVLLSDIPQHLEVLEVERGYGLSYRIGDSADFRARLAELLAGDLRAMGEKASRVAQTELSAEVMSDRYQRLYSEIIEKKKKD